MFPLNRLREFNGEFRFSDTAASVYQEQPLAFVAKEVLKTTDLLLAPESFVVVA